MTGPSDGDAVDARRVVGSGVQTLAARRLGRGFVPLAVLFALGLVGVMRQGGGGSDHRLVAVGAVATAGAMLFQGLAAVRRALGRAGRAEALLTPLCVLIAYAFAFYVLAFEGLRPLARPLGDAPAVTLLGAGLYSLLSGRLLWVLWRLSEVQSLARIMVSPAPEESAEAER